MQKCLGKQSKIYNLDDLIFNNTEVYFVIVLMRKSDKHIQVNYALLKNNKGNS